MTNRHDDVSKDVEKTVKDWGDGHNLGSAIKDIQKEMHHHPERMKEYFSELSTQLADHNLIPKDFHITGLEDKQHVVMRDRAHHNDKVELDKEGHRSGDLTTRFNDGSLIERNQKGQVEHISDGHHRHQELQLKYDKSGHVSQMTDANNHHWHKEGKDAYGFDVWKSDQIAMNPFTHQPMLDERTGRPRQEEFHANIRSVDDQGRVHYDAFDPVHRQPYYGMVRERDGNQHMEGFQGQRVPERGQEGRADSLDRDRFAQRTPEQRAVEQSALNMERVLDIRGPQAAADYFAKQVQELHQKFPDRGANELAIEMNRALASLEHSNHPRMWMHATHDGQMGLHFGENLQAARLTPLEPPGQERTQRPVERADRADQPTDPGEATKASRVENLNAPQQFQQQVADGYAELPAGVRHVLDSHGVKIVAADKMSSAYPNEVNDQPRGYPPGLTSDDAAGEFHPNDNKIVVTRDGSYKQGENPQVIVKHEAGHAFDHALGDYSASKEFLDALERDKAKMPPDKQKEFAYFLQKGAAGGSETFGELFALKTGGHSTISYMEDMPQYFPETYKLVSKKIAEVT